MSSYYKNNRERLEYDSILQLNLVYSLVNDINRIGEQDLWSLLTYFFIISHQDCSCLNNGDPKKYGVCIYRILISPSAI